MKYLSVICLYTLFLYHGLQAQPHFIAIDSAVFEKTEQCLILLSNESGNILQDWKLDSTAIKNVHELTFNIDRQKHQRLDLTVFYEHSPIAISHYYPYFKAITYYDISTTLKIEKQITPNYSYYPEKTRDILIYIEGVGYLNQINYNRYHPKTYSRAIIRGGRLKIQYKLLKESDFFAIIYANDDPQPRTIFLNESDINYPLRLHWDSLNTQIETLEIPLPSKEKWDFDISATNEKTDNRTLLYSTLSEDHPFDWNFFRDRILFIQPNDQAFYDYRLILNRIEPNPENIRISYDFKHLNIYGPIIPKAAYSFNVQQYHDHHLNVAFEGQSYEFMIDFRSARFKTFMEPQYNYGSTLSNWKVKGHADDMVDFSIPDLSFYHDQFPWTEAAKYLYPKQISLKYFYNFEQSITIVKYLNSK